MNSLKNITALEERKQLADSFSLPLYNCDFTDCTATASIRLTSINVNPKEKHLCL